MIRLERPSTAVEVAGALGLRIADVNQAAAEARIPFQPAPDGRRFNIYEVDWCLKGAPFPPPWWVDDVDEERRFLSGAWGRSSG